MVLYLTVLQALYVYAVMTEIVNFVCSSNSRVIFPKMCSVIFIFSSGDLMTLLKLEMIKINSPNQKISFEMGKKPTWVIKISF